MKEQVLLTIRGEQNYEGQEPDVIELVTEGTLEANGDGWDICYQESDLTGMEGVTTSFQLRPEKIVLERTGKLRSRMVFEEGMSHDSLYKLDFGAMMITINANEVRYQVGEDGGTVDLQYDIVIEQSGVGHISYHLDIQKKPVA